jgi:hypothetical protein
MAQSQIIKNAEFSRDTYKKQGAKKSKIKQAEKAAFLDFRKYRANNAPKERDAPEEIQNIMP